jgi:ATP/maltotriose-dependent transcriptional regulator MalT/DNA-binding SARP family transcriptional activator
VGGFAGGSAPSIRLPRPRLERLLDEVRSRRLAIVLGGAGYGKSTLVEGWAVELDPATDPVAWCALDASTREPRVLVDRLAAAIDAATGSATGLGAALAGGTTDDPADALARADGFAAMVSGWLESLDRPLIVVFDDLHELEDAPAATRFIEALVRGAPRAVHLVVTSRLPIAFPIERLRGQGQVIELGAEQLVFDRDEIEDLVMTLEPPATDLTDDIVALAGGWPALTRLVLESLRVAPPADRPAVMARLREPEGPLLAYIAEEVLGRESAATLEVLRVASRFERISPEVLAAIGLPDGAEVLDDLARRMFFVEPRRGGTGRWYTLHTLVREYALRHLPLDETEVRRLHGLAADHWDATGQPVAALRHRILAGQRARVAEMLETRAAELARGGNLDVLVDAARSIPEGERSPAVDVVLGDALMRRGEWDAAIAALRRAGAGQDPLPAAVAWRLGFILHERGDIAAAFDTFASADLVHGDAGDRAQVAAWRTVAHWQREEVEEARAWAARAEAAAEGSDDDRARAAVLAASGAVAHMDGAGQTSIDRFRAAIALAERAGDLLLEVRFRSDLGYNLAFQGRYPEALEAFDLAVTRGAALGNSTVYALTLSDRGQALTNLGRFEEAAADLAAGRQLYEALGSPWAAYPAVKAADVHRLRGDLLVARAAYREVIATAKPLTRPWFLPEGILGLAAATVEDDPEAALALVDEGMAQASTVMNAATPLAAARVSLAAERRDRAAAFARRAQEIAEARRDRSSLAGALDLQALLEDDPAAARELLRQARQLWDETGSPYGQAMHDLAEAEVVGGADGRAAALRAAEAFRRMGARRVADRAMAVADRLLDAATPAVEIRSLGTFQVLRSGRPVPLAEWQSKKARDLLKVLVARRGRAVSRERMCELLWPGDDPGPLLNRLSVALATVRSVLDPERRHSPDHFLRADKLSVSLDLDHLDVDLERFLATATPALRRARAGGPAADAAYAELESIEDLYRGDFLEDEDFEDLEDLAEALRDELRATYLDVARALARRARAVGDADGAVRAYLRILERDPFDEDAHLGVVETLAGVGRHGEARRRYQVYRARMADLQLEAAPYPATRRVTASDATETAGVATG